MEIITIIEEKAHRKIANNHVQISFKYLHKTKRPATYIDIWKFCPKYSPRTYESALRLLHNLGVAKKHKLLSKNDKIYTAYSV